MLIAGIFYEDLPVPHDTNHYVLNPSDLPAFFGPAIAGEGRQLTRSLT